MLKMLDDKKIKELKLLDELFLITENSKYLEMRNNEIYTIINNENFENHLSKVCLPLIEYKELKQDEKYVINEEIEEILFSKIENYIELK